MGWTQIKTLIGPRHKKGIRIRLNMRRVTPVFEIYISLDILDEVKSGFGKRLIAFEGTGHERGKLLLAMSFSKDGYTVVQKAKLKGMVTVPAVGALPEHPPETSPADYRVTKDGIEITIPDWSKVPAARAYKKTRSAPAPAKPTPTARTAADIAFAKRMGDKSFENMKFKG